MKPTPKIVARIKLEIAKRKINFAKKDFTYIDLLEGAKVETEHADTLNNSIPKIVDTALDHLSESGKYYRELKKMESKLDKESCYKLGFIIKCADLGIDASSLLDLKKAAGAQVAAVLDDYYRRNHIRPEDDLIDIGPLFSNAGKSIKKFMHNVGKSTKKALPAIGSWLYHGLRGTPTVRF